VFLTPAEAMLVFSGPGRKGAVVRMRPIGANPAPRVVSRDPLPGRVNYFIGNDPRGWRTGIATYARVHYEGVYPGVDLVYHGSGGDLEYDFLVAPGGDPSVISMSIEGADALEIDRHGDLVIGVAGEQIRQRRPTVYQEIDGTRRGVAGSFVLRDGHQVGFEVGPYDAGRPLVIDPVLTYSTYVGGSSTDIGSHISVDVAGNVYLTGETRSADFPTTAGVWDTALGGIRDVFVTKLNPTGTALIYSTYLGGSASDNARRIVVDAAGSVLVAGTTASADFPTTVGAFDTTANGDLDVFVTKLNAAGSGLLYSTYLGGTLADALYGLAADATGDAYVTGLTVSADFPTTGGAIDTTANGGTYDAFVTRINAAGSALVYSTYMGGAGDETGVGIVVDSSGNAYVAGNTSSADFPTTPGAYDRTCGTDGSCDGNRDAFVAKVNPAGTSLIYSTYFGGVGLEGSVIAIDGAGNAYMTGPTTSPDLPTTAGAFDTTANGGYDAYAAKLNPAGTALVYSTYLGGVGDDWGNSIAVDAQGHAYLTGPTSSSDFPAVAAFDAVLSGSEDGFVAKLNPAGSALLYSTFLGGSGADTGLSVVLGGVGTVYVTGDTTSSNFPTTSGVFDATCGTDGTCNGGLRDAFVVRISPSPTVGLYNPAAGVFHLRNTNSGGPADLTFAYGAAGAGWIALAGDWDGNGTVTVGMYDPASSAFYLRNSNTPGSVDVPVFQYGPAGAGWIPLVGDWDGDGDDTVGLYNPATGTFYLRNANTTGAADLTFVYGPAGMMWVPLVGDWDGDGDETVGLYNPATAVFYLRNTNGVGVADLTFVYGAAGVGWVPLVGDWDGDGDDTIGAYDPGTATFYLRNVNSAGPNGPAPFGYGPAGLGWLPRIGDWDGS
jgi:hypothetical protein